MTKQELIEKIERSHSEWEALISQIGRDRLGEPGVTGDWSVKDLIAHVAAWQQRVLDRMDADKTGQPAEFTGWDVNDVNDRLYERHRGRSAEDILAFGRDTYARFIEHIGALTEEQIFKSGHFSFTKENVLYDWIAGDTFEHYDEHSATIREWLQKVNAAV